MFLSPHASRNLGRFFPFSLTGVSSLRFKPAARDGKTAHFFLSGVNAMRVKALQKFYYNRRDMLPGESFEMDDREVGEAKILATLGKIEILKQTMEAQPAKQPQKQQQAAPETLPPLQEQRAAVGPMTTDSGMPMRRQYRRRDLKAEE
jgi:hypothetical protein